MERFPKKSDRQKFLLNSNSSIVKSYFDNLHRLSLKDRSYAKYYKEDYQFYNKNQSGGFLSGKKKEPFTCSGIDNSYCDNLLEKLITIAKTLEKNACKTSLDSKSKKLITLFLNLGSCCDELFQEGPNRNAYINYMILIIKTIKHSKPMLTFAVDYVNKLVSENNELINNEFIKDYNKFYYSKDTKNIKQAVTEIQSHINNKENNMTIVSALRTAFFMRFLKENSKLPSLILSADPYIKLD